MGSSLMAKYKAAKEAEKNVEKSTPKSTLKDTSKDTFRDTPKSIDKSIFTNTSMDTQFNFMGLWKALGKKKQHNLPLTHDLARVVDEEGGSEYILKILLSDLEKKGKLSSQYRMFLEF